MPESNRDDAPALPDRRMCVGEGVDPPMHDDPGANIRRESVPQRTMNEIAGQIPDEKLRLRAAEKEVSEMVHE